VLDAEVLRPDVRAARVLDHFAEVAHRAHDVLVGAVAVVVDALGDPVAVGVEPAPDVRERVPLRGVLQAQRDLVVADHVGRLRVDLAQREVHERLAVAVRRVEARRMAARVELVPARVVERERQAEHEAFAHLGDRLLHLFGREEIEPPDLVVGTEVAPGGACGTVLPTGVHARSSGTGMGRSLAWRRTAAVRGRTPLVRQLLRESDRV
jgi:hypothetical protein